eukprot:TRINITY_DN17970_c0_g1_i1.p1 TRINITY_DN17970_c0_g1~~TRINITY_DN17970_c0_g1_i1.p1  ORF type:complete len:606 (+),score=91.07 TRINITY_DN17970_c0_g1_i1:51-1868(+)
MGCSTSSAVPDETLHEAAEPSVRADSSASSRRERSSSKKSRSERTVSDFMLEAKKLLEKGQKPSGCEFEAFARYLGIDTDKDKDLLWIAEECLAAPCPAGWSEHVHENRIFYYDNKTRSSSWTHPLESLHRQTYRTIKEFTHDLTPAQQTDRLKSLQREHETQSSDAAMEMLDWTKHTDSSGLEFFFNRVRKVSTWADPRLATVHQLHLQKKMLDVLQGSSIEPADAEDDVLVRKDSIKRTMSFGAGADMPVECPKKPEPLLKDKSLGVEPLPCKGTEWRTLCQLMYVTDPENLGIGRDVKEADGKYNRLMPVRAWKINRQAHWMIFDAARSMLSDDLQRVRKLRSVPKVQGNLRKAARWLGVMGTECNEQILLHGTKPENLLTIIHSGLSEKVSRGLLGHGVYLAEDPSKMDQYCTPDTGPGMPGLEKLHAELYSDDHSHPGRCFYALVCRVTLGLPVFTKNGKTDLHNPLETIFRASDRRELALVPGTEPAISYHSLIAEPGSPDDGYILQRHREFVVFNCNRILEQYIIAYKRDNSNEPMPVQIDDISFVEDAVDDLMEPARTSLIMRSAKERLLELAELRDAGLITCEEFELKRQKILDEF